MKKYSPKQFVKLLSSLKPGDTFMACTYDFTTDTNGNPIAHIELRVDGRRYKTAQRKQIGYSGGNNETVDAWLDGISFKVVENNGRISTRRPNQHRAFYSIK